MKLPKSILILGEKHTLKLVDGLMEEHGAEGMFLPQAKTILIDRALKDHPAYALRTLWHEIAHAYALESGLHEILSHDALEQFCQTFSALVIQTTGGKLKRR